VNNCNSKQNCAAVILAGGEGRRLQTLTSSKPLLRVAGKPLLEYQIDQLGNQFADLLINSEDQNLSRYQLTLIGDGQRERLGPLAGIYASMCYLRQHRPEIEWLQVCPVDTPLQPQQLHQQLAQAIGNRHIALAQCPGANTEQAPKWQPLHSLWSLSLAPALADYLQQGQYRVMSFIKQQPHIAVDFCSAQQFSNINQPTDLAQIEALLSDANHAPRDDQSGD